MSSKNRRKDFCIVGFFFKTFFCVINTMSIFKISIFYGIEFIHLHRPNNLFFQMEINQTTIDLRELITIFLLHSKCIQGQLLAMRICIIWLELFTGFVIDQNHTVIIDINSINIPRKANGIVKFDTERLFYCHRYCLIKRIIGFSISFQISMSSIERDLYFFIKKFGRTFFNFFTKHSFISLKHLRNFWCSEIGTLFVDKFESAMDRSSQNRREWRLFACLSQTIYFIIFVFQWTR